MTDPRIERLARILVQYSTKVRPGDLVAIRCQPQAMPIIREIYREILRAGGHPYYTAGGLRSHADLQELEYILFAEASDEQLQHVHKIEEMVLSKFDAMISLYSATNTRNLSTVDPDKQSLRTMAHVDTVKIYRERSASGDLRWVRSLYPTNAYAQDAEMNLQEFEDFVYSTTYADLEDPIEHWHMIHNEQQKLVDWFAGKKKLEVKGPDVDLALSIEGRAFINSDGTKNMPSGEIYTSPIEDSMEGWIRYTYPAIRQGKEVEGIELSFEKGKIVKATAKKNEAFLLSMLDIDPGARYIGEFAIGTNQRINRFTKNMLFDEKIGGTIHMAVGYGFAQIGSKNESAIHWDMICDMRGGGQILADGELIYDSGKFLI